MTLDPVSALLAESRRLRREADRAGMIAAERLRRDADVVERCVAIVEENL